jgi:hypothetical protein
MFRKQQENLLYLYPLFFSLNLFPPSLPFLSRSVVHFLPSRLIDLLFQHSPLLGILYLEANVECCTPPPPPPHRCTPETNGLNRLARQCHLLSACVVMMEGGVKPSEK